MRRSDAGDTFTIERGGRTIVEAQNDAIVCVLARYIATVRSGAARPSIAARVRYWLGSGGAADASRRWMPYF